MSLDFIHLPLAAGKKIYFASDFHLGAHALDSSLVRERKLVEWLEQIQVDAAHIFLLGDLFDFWYEYRTAVPKGFVRFFGKLAQLADAGVPITIYTGNHDMWMFDYFQKEFGINVLRKPQSYLIGQTRFHLGHGDGLGNGDYKYKVLKQIFENDILRWLFRWVHPDLGIWLAHTWAKSSRRRSKKIDESFKAREKEWIWQYCHQIEQKQHHEHYVFGHRHLPLDLEVAQGSRYLNLGEWLTHYTYAVFDGNSLTMKSLNQKGFRWANQ